MSRTKVFKRTSDSRVLNTWKPLLENHGITAESGKQEWLAEYAHNHAIFDNSAPLFEQTAPGLFFQQPGSVLGMGNPVAPTPGQTPFSDAGVKGSYADSGSGDKFPSLLPVAIQVAAKTIGFDLVPVVPMDSPVGFLPYLDYLYAGGRTDTDFEPYMVKLEGITADDFATAPAIDVADCTFAGGGTAGTYRFVGFSRVDGQLIIKVLDDGGAAVSVTDDLLNAGNTLVDAGS